MEPCQRILLVSETIESWSKQKVRVAQPKTKHIISETKQKEIRLREGGREQQIINGS